jgi:hypothetical protein
MYYSESRRAQTTEENWATLGPVVRPQKLEGAKSAAWPSRCGTCSGPSHSSTAHVFWQAAAAQRVFLVQAALLSYPSLARCRCHSRDSHVSGCAGGAGEIMQAAGECPGEWLAPEERGARGGGAETRGGDCKKCKLVVRN